MGAYAALSSWAEERSAEEARERREEERARVEEEQRRELREEATSLMPEVISGVALGMTREEVREVRGANEVPPAHPREVPALDFLEEQLANGGEVVYGFDRQSGALAQVQVLSMMPTLQGIAPHLAAMNERYGTPTGVWDCPDTGGVPTRRFTWRHAEVTVSDVFLVYGDRVSLTLYVTSTESTAASLQRSRCHPVPREQLDRFPVARPEALQPPR